MILPRRTARVRARSDARRVDGVVDGAGDRGDEGLARDVGDVVDAVVAAEPQHDDAVGDGHHVGHVVADQDHAVPALAEALDEVQHLGGLRDAERRGRLVEDDDARIADQRARDRDGLALPAGERGDRDPHRRDLRRQLAQQRPGLLLHVDLVERAAACAARGRATGWRRRRGCRTARGPGRPSRSRAPARRRGSSISTGSPSYSIVPESGACTPDSTLTSVDLPAPLSPMRATTSPSFTQKSTSVSALTAPKCLPMPRIVSTRSRERPVAGCVIDIEVMLSSSARPRESAHRMPAASHAAA